MKQTYSLIVMFFMAAIAFAQQPIITAIVDGDCTGGTPKVIEIYISGTVNLADFSIERFNNSSTTLEWQRTTNLATLSSSDGSNNPGTITDEFIYITDSSNNVATFQAEFPSVPANRLFVSNVAGNNGNDSIRIILDADSSVVDQFGTEVDGNGENWEYTDSYATRIDGTGPDGGFTEANWSFSAPGTLDVATTGLCKDPTNPTYEATIGRIGQYSPTASTSPTLNINGGPISGLDYFENNGPSSAQTFTVSGMNLTTDISLTADANFEISLAENSGYGTNLDVTQTGGDVPATTIYVRLVAGLTTGTYSGEVSIGSTGATTTTVAVSGDVAADDPFITLAGFLDGLDYNEGSGPSAADTFGVSGRFLTADITITADNEFEISLDETGTYTTSIAIAPSNGTVDDTTVYVRLRSGETAGSYSGTITASSADANDQTLATSGTVNAAATCAAEGSVIISEVMQNPAQNGDPAGEYFELYNTTNTDIDIQSWTIKDDVSSGEIHTIATSLVIPAGGYIVIANGATPNGGLTPDYTYGNDISLGNSVDGLIIECGGNTIDTVVWDGSWPYGSGISMELAVESLNSVANDTSDNWTAATTPYGDGDLGTPGAPNGATASNETQSVLQFSLYPNPATSGTLNINVTNGGSVDVEIFSTLGQRVVYQKAVTTSVNIDGLNTGLYIVKLTQGEASQTRKLVVK